MVHQFSGQIGSHTTGIHHFHLPSEVTVVPESGYLEKPQLGEYFRKGEIFPKTETQVGTEKPYSIAAHEIGHHLWYQLTPKERDEFILTLDRWWKRELPQHVGKEFFVNQKGTPLPKLEWQEYLGTPSEIFARFTSYYALGEKLPRKESEEAWKVYNKIMKKHNGNFKQRLQKASNKVETAVTFGGYARSDITEKEKVPAQPEWREKIISLKGI